MGQFGRLWTREINVCSILREWQLSPISAPKPPFRLRPRLCENVRHLRGHRRRFFRSGPANPKAASILIQRRCCRSMIYGSPPDARFHTASAIFGRCDRPGAKVRDGSEMGFPQSPLKVRSSRQTGPAAYVRLVAAAPFPAMAAARTREAGLSVRRWTSLQGRMSGAVAFGGRGRSVHRLSMRSWSRVQVGPKVRP